MDKHAISVTARRALAATGVGVVGLVVALPAQAALADGGGPSASVTNNTLTITGTDGGDTIQIGLGADPGTLVVDLGNGALPQSFDRSTFNAISVFLLRGDDTFTATAGGAFSDEALTVSGGPGDDTITGSAGGDTLIGGPGDDTINGADGNDLVFGDGGADVVDGQRGTDTEFLGGGRDTAVWFPGEGSDVVDGGAGHDNLFFHGANIAERLALTANGSSDVLTRDVGLVRMDLSDVEALDLTTLGGADTFTEGDLAGTDLGAVDVDLAATGGGGDAAVDSIVVTGRSRADNIAVGADGSDVTVDGLPASTRISGAEPTDLLQVNAAGGDDTVNVSDAARSLITVGVDLGGGQR